MRRQMFPTTTVLMPFSNHPASICVQIQFKLERVENWMVKRIGGEDGQCLFLPIFSKPQQAGYQAQSACLNPVETGQHDLLAVDSRLSAVESQ